MKLLRGMNGGKQNNRWKCWWVALTSTIWQHRNKILFSNESFSATKLMDDALFLLWSWLRASEKDFNMHFNYWSTNLSICFSLFQQIRRAYQQWGIYIGGFTSQGVLMMYSFVGRFISVRMQHVMWIHQDFHNTL